MHRPKTIHHPSTITTTTTINSNSNTNTNITADLEMKFEPPVRVDLVGSYLLDTLCKPALNVDLAIEIPQVTTTLRGFTPAPSPPRISNATTITITPPHHHPRY